MGTGGHRRLANAIIGLAAAIWLAGGLLPAAPAYYFSTMAGITGAGTNDGQGALARLNMPRGITMSRSGEIFVADTLNHTVRRLTTSGTNWNVTTIAGAAGQPGTNDGPNATARFYYPWGITVDTATNLYVTDGNHTLRLVRRDGTTWRVSTVAGRAGTASFADGAGGEARFNTPAGVAVDPVGGLYVADSQNRRLRRLDSEGFVHTLEPEYETPVVGLAADFQGILYLTQPEDNTVWRLHPGGFFEQFAGDSEPGSRDGFRVGARFYRPSAAAVDSWGTLFLADTGNHLVRRVDLTGFVSSIAGKPSTFGSEDGSGEEARFHSPGALAVGPSGEIAVADTRNNAIRLLEVLGHAAHVRTIAGRAGNGSTDGTAGQARFSGPTHVAVGPSNEVYVSDTENHTIRRIVRSAAGTTVSTMAGAAGQATHGDGTGTAAKFNAPSGLAATTNGSLFVSDGSNHVLRLMVWTNGAYAVSTIAGSVTNAGNANGTGSQARFNSPGGCAMDASGALFVCDTGNSRIRRIARSGTQWAVTTIAGNSVGFADGANTSARFFEPNGIAVDDAGALYIADTGNHVIRRVARVGNNWVTTTIGGAAGQPGFANGTNTAARFDRPFGIAVDASRRVYVSEPESAVIRVLEPLGTNWVVRTFAGGRNSHIPLTGIGVSARFIKPAGLGVGKDGRLYVADQWGDAVWVGEPLPSLSISRSASGPVIAWEPWAFDYVLETSSLAATNPWVVVGNSTNPFTVPTPSAGNPTFFRLRRLLD